MTDTLTDGYQTIEGFTANETKRFEQIKNSFLIAKAEVFADRISPIMDDPLVNDLVRDPRVFCHIITGDKGEIDPHDRQQMRMLARDIVDANFFASRNVEFSDHARRTQLAKDFLESLKPTQRRKRPV